MTRSIPLIAAFALGGAGLAIAVGDQGQSPASQATSPQAIALGDSIFKGKAGGGLCYTCHQLNAKGMPGLAPDLTDDKWIHGDGSYDFIVATVAKGVPKPKQAIAPMPPKGGASLTDAQVHAVAAYVYSLSKGAK
jgi:mono/diheme cytochrome c family protein